MKGLLLSSLEVNRESMQTLIAIMNFKKKKEREKTKTFQFKEQYEKKN